MTGGMLDGERERKRCQSGCKCPRRIGQEKEDTYDPDCNINPESKDLSVRRA
jgi:hypothetical protein